MNKLQIISVFTKIMELLSIAASYKIIFPNKTIDLPLWLLKLIKVFNMFFKDNFSLFGQISWYHQYEEK
jgi:hypothetical protein